MRRWTFRGLPIALAAFASPAVAQIGEELVIQPQIPQNYNRGRNIAVDEQARPAYAPLGVRVSSFILFPRIELGTGGTTNTYYGPSQSTPSAFVTARPNVKLVSDWSRHSLQLTGTALVRDYIGQSRRNENLWTLDAAGRIELGDLIQVEMDANSSLALENLFSGEVSAGVAALSRYRRDYGSVQTTYTNGRGRAFLVADVTDFRFRPIPLVGGSRRDQSDRNRNVVRLTGQVEYARSPSISLFAQLSGGRTSYDRDLLTGGPNLDSKGVRALGGVNVDIAGRMRGTIGLGYSIRSYDAAVYRSVRGFSIETRMQIFPTRRITVTGTGQRLIDDASFNKAPFWNTRLGLRADYDLLRNAILSSAVDYSHYSYIGSSSVSNTYRGTVSGRYLVSRRFSLQGSLSYSRRATNDTTLGSVKEGRLEMGVAYQL